MAALSFSILTITIITSSNYPENFSIYLAGNNFFSSSFLLEEYNQIKTFSDIEKIIKNIIEKYNDVGFPFCTIRPEVTYYDSSLSKIILHITEGARVIIKDYLFKTDGKTETSQLKKFIHIKTDELFSLKNLNKTKKAILKMNIFSDINTSIIQKNENYYLVFDLKEKSTDYLIGAGSLAQNNQSMAIDFYSLNIFGTLRQFQFRFESNLTEKDKKRLFMINFTEPIMLNPVVFNIGFAIWTHDSARLAQLNLTFTAPLHDYLSIILTNGIEMNNYIIDTIQNNSTSTLLGIGLESDYYKNGLTISNKFVLDYLFRTNERLRLRYDGSFKYGHLFLKPHYCLVNTESFGYFDYIRLGGANSIRGYTEDEFFQKQAWWVNLEYKLFPFYPILDIAGLNNDYFYAYGVGIDARSNFAELSIVFAWPEKGKWYDGKVHIILEKAF